MAQNISLSDFLRSLGQTLFERKSKDKIISKPVLEAAPVFILSKEDMTPGLHAWIFNNEANAIDDTNQHEAEFEGGITEQAISRASNQQTA